ncbi:MAG: autoinducer binding domain-containing protein [Deltaproteobacteria bacterium]|nr:autoinducer binding domain-containing protein [Deltaproteobacteria bacterium]MBZ0219630.1 autoinducer binding domain-containing protein [Deltaproteobacteria bacterium]
MPYGNLSKRELVRILELIELSQKCFGPEDLKKLILDSRDLFGAEFAVCGLLEPGRPVITGFVNGNYPEEWVSRYMSCNYQGDDPVVRFHSNFAVTQLWSDVFKRYNDPKSRELLKNASDYRIKHGVTASVYVPDIDKIAVFSFSDSRDVFKDRHKKLGDILAAHLHGALVRAISPSPAIDISESLGPERELKEGLDG